MINIGSSIIQYYPVYMFKYNSIITVNSLPILPMFDLCRDEAHDSHDHIFTLGFMA